MVDSIDTVRTNLVASLQAIIDVAEVKSKDLRTQRDALRKQLTDLQAQIVTAEGPDAQKARDDLVQLQQFQQRQQRRGGT